MRKYRGGSLLLFISVFVSVLFYPLFARSDVPTMTKEELKPHIGVPGFVIIDIRTTGDWEKSEYKIKGALREEPNAAQDWATKYPKAKAIVLYCA